MLRGDSNTAYADISTQDSYEDVDPTPVTESESERVPQIATDAYQTLYGQEDQVSLPPPQAPGSSSSSRPRAHRESDP